MAISESARHDLYTGLRDVIGPERAETLMSAIPLHDLDEVVTKADLRAEIAELRVGLRAEITEVSTAVARLETKLEAQQTALHRHLNRLLGAVLISIVGAMFGVGILT
ncbi:MAG TPA: hypothetical protein VMP13_07115 [Acidimicrobiia bacterium]|nr:hypothetical protein [Acidimicrobiia bacterium]